MQAMDQDFTIQANYKEWPTRSGTGRWLEIYERGETLTEYFLLLARLQQITISYLVQRRSRSYGQS